MEEFANKEAFLNNLYARLQTTPTKTADHPFKSPTNLPAETLSELSEEELLEVLTESCRRVHAQLMKTTRDNLLNVLDHVFTDYQDGQILLPQVPLVEDYDILNLQNESRRFVKWNLAGTKREDNIHLAETSNIALSFPKFLLAESGTIVVESSDVQGRSFHFLPRHYVAIVKKSQVVPRMTQAASYFDEKVQHQQRIGSCLHFISGPSNSGDIEMQLVTGLHGPVAVSYVLIEDE